MQRGARGRRVGRRAKRDAEVERSRLPDELRQYRGIEWASADREHRNAPLDIWRAAPRQVIRGPGIPEPSGYVEFHLYRKSIERLGTGLTQYDNDDDCLNLPILHHVLHPLSLAVGHPVPAERRGRGCDAFPPEPGP